MLRIYCYTSDRTRILRAWRRTPVGDPAVDRAVWEIIDAVRGRGDAAVAEFTRRFDGVALSPEKFRNAAERFRIAPERLREAWRSLPPDVKEVLKLARERIRRFHERQRRKGFVLRDAMGATLEQRVLPLESVGLYVPGGKAAYPSTVLMCAVPAGVAGVQRIVMVTPPHEDHSLANQATWGAAWLAGVREAYAIGGAQAVAALAFGTESIPRVDKVVGPGNKYVATAKKLLYGQIDIDSVAGPSEVMILADETARPDWLAVDLMAQAEHDEAASSILVLIDGAGEARTDGAKKRDGRAAAKGIGARIQRLAEEVQAELKSRAARSPRQKIARASLRANGALIFVPTREAAVELANLRAPEHLEIVARSPRALAARIRHAGAIFIGPHTPEAFGDYIAGPNHTLPTGGTARFFSPLGVDDFVKTSNVLTASPRAVRHLAPAGAILADVEGLAAHADSLRIRLTRNG